MQWYSLEKIWKIHGRKDKLKVRFNDWQMQTKYFVIMGESEDGRRLIGVLDTGEKISFSKKSQGWDLYMSGDEHVAHAV